MLFMNRNKMKRRRNIGFRKNRIYKYVLYTSFLIFLNPFYSCTKNKNDSPPTNEDSSGNNSPTDGDDHQEVPSGAQELTRAISLIDSSFSSYFETGNGGLKVHKSYNPFTKKKSTEIGSIWVYSSSIQAISFALKGLQEIRGKDAELYDQHFQRLKDLLEQIYEDLDYYLGTFTLTSYTQTKEWSVYAVGRANAKGTADVTGTHNVYDDQIWLIRDLLHAYEVLGDKKYLDKAEYLTNYVLDGWDPYRNANGEEVGGITWGPSYRIKNGPSNGSLINALVQLSNFYENKEDQIEHRFIDPADKRTRLAEMENKSTYYLDFAVKIYEWQKKNLLIGVGVYNDLMGNAECEGIPFETIDGVRYRKSCPVNEPAGPPLTYNSGTMLSGGAFLYDRLKEKVYLDDIEKLADASFRYFGNLGKERPNYYSYPWEGSSPWFNSILVEGYYDVSRFTGNEKIDQYLQTFQDNLDYAYKTFSKGGILPANLLMGWERDGSGYKAVDGLFNFGYAAQYAILAIQKLCEK